MVNHELFAATLTTHTVYNCTHGDAFEAKFACYMWEGYRRHTGPVWEGFFPEPREFPHRSVELRPSPFPLLRDPPPPTVHRLGPCSTSTSLGDWRLAGQGLGRPTSKISFELSLRRG